MNSNYRQARLPAGSELQSPDQQSALLRNIDDSNKRVANNNPIALSNTRLQDAGLPSAPGDASE